MRARNFRNMVWYFQCILMAAKLQTASRVGFFPACLTKQLFRRQLTITFKSGKHFKMGHECLSALEVDGSVLWKFFKFESSARFCMIYSFKCLISLSKLNSTFLSNPSNCDCYKVFRRVKKKTEKTLHNKWLSCCLWYTWKLIMRERKKGLTKTRFLMHLILKFKGL